MAPVDGIWSWNDFSGGMAEDGFVGQTGSYQMGYGIDTQKFPKGVTLANKINNFSSPIVVTDNVLNFINPANFGGAYQFAFTDDKKIYRVSDGQVVYTLPSDGLNAGYLTVGGSNYLYILSFSSIHKILLSDTTQNDWTSYITTNYRSYTGNGELRPVLNINTTTFIFGSGGKLYKMNNLEVVTEIFVGKPGEVIRGITLIGDLVRVYMNGGDNGVLYIFNKSDIVGTSNITPLTLLTREGHPIIEVIGDGNYDYVITGLNNNYSGLYIASGYTKQMLYQTGDASSFGLDFGRSYNTMALRKGILHILGYIDTFDKFGVLTYGKHKTINKQAINTEIDITGANYTSAIMCLGNTTLVGYSKDGVDYIGKIAHNEPDGSGGVGVIVSRKFGGARIDSEKTIKHINIGYSLISGNIKIYARKNEDRSFYDTGWTLLTTITDSQKKFRRITRAELLPLNLGDFNYIEFKVEITQNSGNYSPIFYGLNLTYTDNLKE